MAEKKLISFSMPPDDAEWILDAILDGLDSDFWDWLAFTWGFYETTKEYEHDGYSTGYEYDEHATDLEWKHTTLQGRYDLIEDYLAGEGTL